MATSDHESPELDLTRLRPEERELWDRYFARKVPNATRNPFSIWSFGYACMLEPWGPPDVVNEYLKEVDPENTITQYLENVRRAYRERS